MGRIRTGLLLLLAACGGAQPAVNVESVPASKPVTAAPAAAAPNGEYGSKLAEARRLRDELLAKKAPTPAKYASREQAMRFVNTKLKDWYTDVRPRVDADETAYAAAFDAATTQSERGTALNELADMQLTFVERAMASGTDAMPTEWRRDDEIAAAYQSALYLGFEPYVVRARKVITHCQEVAAGSCAPSQSRLTTLEQSAPKG